jgi:hypothetical protein
MHMPVRSPNFEVMGVRLLEGRTFDERDSASSRPVLVVSETFAREQFAGERAVGKMIRFFTSRPGAEPPPSREIVGVVRDVRQDGMPTRPIAQMYSPYPQTPWGFVSFFVEVSGHPATVLPLLQGAVSAVDPSRPVRDVKLTADIVGESLARQRAMTWMLSALACIALLLAAIGLYGVSATAASARAREIAIRAAIGAQPGSLLRLMLRQGLIATVLGVTIGASIGLLTTNGLGALLYETGPRDPLTFVVTATVLVAVAALATYLPARRALRANPAEVLRAET